MGSNFKYVWLDFFAASNRGRNQNGLDTCIYQLVARHLAEGEECLMVGDLQTGFIVVPHKGELSKELEDRCKETG